MTELFLFRSYHAQGTQGDIYLDSQFVCHTIELPWKANERMISCIPEGRYELVLLENYKLGRHLKLRCVPNRSGILIHAANNALEELKGCIAPVMRLTGVGKGTGSRKALKILVYLAIRCIYYKQRLFLTILNKENELCT